jgi:hypothetical protein
VGAQPRARRRRGGDGRDRAGGRRRAARHRRDGCTAHGAGRGRLVGGCRRRRPGPDLRRRPGRGDPLDGRGRGCGRAALRDGLLLHDRPDHGVAPESSFFAYADAKAAADEHLRTTGLAWTILGPSRLTDDPGTGCIETGPGVAKSSVSRDDVAEVIAQVLETPATSRRTIDFNNGSTPVLDAIAASP